MTTIIFSVLLMSFLLWSYSVLNKNFGVNSNSVAAPISTSRRFSITLILFLACYAFISFAGRESNNQQIDEKQYAATFPQISQQDRAIQDEKDNRPLPWDKTKGFKIIPADKINTKFSDVAGLTEAKDEIQDVIDFLQDPDAFSRLGAKSPKGILLYGAPGTGKTLLARAIAGESNVAFIAVAGAEFDEEYVGVGAARVRQLFELARDNAPCIIFIDEIDALAHKRHSHDPGWSAQTVNQLLAEMDGLDNFKNQGIVIIGASNRISAMDPAIMRPGRLDRHIKLDVPTLSERTEILSLYLNKITVDTKVKAETIAKMTSGFSSAELANLVNEAAINATKLKKNSVEIGDFEQAKDRLILGSKRDALKITEKTRKTTAYHEAGHALVGHLLNAENNPIYKVTITPRGPTLGHTSFEPGEEQYSMNATQIEAMIATQLAGRIAEELIFGEQNITTGAENDLQQATKLAYSMVTRWGYSKRIGLISYNEEMDFIPKEVIEQEVQAIIVRNQAHAKEILIKNRTQLDNLAKALLDRETLDAKEIKTLLTAR